MTLLRIDSGARRNSISRQLTSKFVETWKKQHPGGRVLERDLASTLFRLLPTSGRSPLTPTPQGSLQRSVKHFPSQRL